MRIFQAANFDPGKLPDRESKPRHLHSGKADGFLEGSIQKPPGAWSREWIQGCNYCLTVSKIAELNFRSEKETGLKTDWGRPVLKEKVTIKAKHASRGDTSVRIRWSHPSSEERSLLISDCWQSRTVKY
ncbi:hypothetical protein CAPTEDRAFT_194921 [Capitella teleta]|uniref:Uncharacterized protein n=1 Tax=Capitella teleta TaxID=283909 RepID=R7U2N5_CAPTE|nr:hypothetical protein CAPTEDRAFT_194921 [Capitella teleta]|eukprot:ELT97430.1 hypothetical protein CAPTEDRAFT_194921 [Capitella teleta]